MSDTRQKVAALLPFAERLHRGHCWLKTADGPRRISEPLDDFKLAEHVAGRKAYGACPIAPGTSTCRVACLDFDSHKGETEWPAMVETAQSVAFLLEQDGYTPHLFRSSGGNGIHLYLLFDEPQDAYSVRVMLRAAIESLGFTSGTGGVAKQQIEVFPKQDEVGPDNFGSMFVIPGSGKSEPLGEFTGWQASPAVPLVERPPKPERTISSTPEIERLRSALDAIPNDTDPLDYDLWRNVIFALHHATEGSDEGLALAHEFSARSGKYDPEFLDNRVWPYVGVNSAAPITERSLFAVAGQHGWQDPTVMDDFDVVEEDGDEPPARKLKRFEFMQAAAFSAGRPPGWIIKGVLPRAELVVIYGESGAGKSFLALDLMGAIAQGLDWRGHKTTQGLHCGYIAAEGAAGFRNRLQAYAQHHQAALDALPLAVMAGAPNFMEAADIKALVASIQAYGRLDVLVVDTLAQVTAGANENSGEDMGRVIAHCKTLHVVTGATIVLIHHSGKDASRGARGWSGIKGALDAELEVTRSDNERAVTISKLKDGAGEGQGYGFRLLDVPLGMDDDGEVFGSCVVEHTAGVPTFQRATKRDEVQAIVLRTVSELLELSGEGASVSELFASAPEKLSPPAAGKKDTRRARVMKAFEALVAAGELVVEGGRAQLA